MLGLLLLQTFELHFAQDCPSKHMTLVAVEVLVAMVVVVAYVEVAVVVALAAVVDVVVFVVVVVVGVMVVACSDVFLDLWLAQRQIVVDV
jgi:hypothetical protein